MRTESHVRLAIAAPIRGWLPFDLELGTYVLSCQGSGVMNDPLAEIVALAAYARDPRDDSTVELWQEPALYVIDVTAWDAKHFRVRIQFADQAIPPARRDERFEVCCECLVERGLFAKAITRGLDVLFEKLPECADNHWATYARSRDAHRSHRTAFPLPS